MHRFLLMLLACRCFAQEAAPIGIIRGDLLAWSGTAKSGELVFRNLENRVFQCSFDERTYFERSNERITVTGTSRGDHVEVLSDRKTGTGICYARTVQITDTKPARLVPVQRIRPQSYRSATDLFAPRGNLTFAGVVLKISADELLLRTRLNERKTILLRADTRFLGAGESLDRTGLAVNTRVFIRAGKNIEDQVEAYQIIWGDILEPVITPEN